MHLTLDHDNQTWIGFDSGDLVATGVPQAVVDAAIDATIAAQAEVGIDAALARLTTAAGSKADQMAKAVRDKLAPAISKQVSIETKQAAADNIVANFEAALAAIKNGEEE